MQKLWSQQECLPVCRKELSENKAPSGNKKWNIKGGYTPAIPIFGSWQGATKSVVNWVLTSSVIQKIHLTTFKGCKLESMD